MNLSKLLAFKIVKTSQFIAPKNLDIFIEHVEQH